MKRWVDAKESGAANGQRGTEGRRNALSDTATGEKRQNLTLPPPFPRNCSAVGSRDAVRRSGFTPARPSL